MSQQMVNDSHYDGSVTITNRMTSRYAVVNPPFSGKHMGPQDEKSKEKRKVHWRKRNADLVVLRAYIRSIKERRTTNV